MIENLEAGGRAVRVLRVTAAVLFGAALVVGLHSRAGIARQGEAAGTGDASVPSPPALPSALPEPASHTGTDGGSRDSPGEGFDASVREAALAELLAAGGEDTDEPESPRSGVSGESARGVPQASRALEPEPLGRAEVVARVERDGVDYWLFTAEPGGRLLGAAAPSRASPTAEAVLRRTGERFELLTPERRYRVVEPPWEAAEAAVVGGSP